MLKENILARRRRVCGFSSLFADDADYGGLEIGHFGIFLISSSSSSSSSLSVGTSLGWFRFQLRKNAVETSQGASVSQVSLAIYTYMTIITITTTTTSLHNNNEVIP